MIRLSASVGGLSRNTAIAYVCSLLSFGCGMAVAMRSGDWSWFARSGSLVVVIGIVLTSRQILEHNRRLREDRIQRELVAARQERRGADSRGRAQRDWAGDQGMRALVRARTREEQSWEIEGHGLYLLIAGTLVWGFGDLVGELPFV